MLRRSTIQLLRFHFSLFLLPVFLFAASESIPHGNAVTIWIIFGILHGLVYPASNGYNSYMDRDETPIGGLEHPEQPTRQLFYVTVVMDAAAVFLSGAFVGFLFAAGVLGYIAASRAYSCRRIRLKRYPVIGFLTVFLFQGAWIFYIVAESLNAAHGGPLLPAALAASCLIGALYPLTQIYQHETDRADGVITISYRLGKRGSFVFSGILFTAALGLLYYNYDRQGAGRYTLLFLLFTLPVVLYFMGWLLKVWKDESAADFRHSFRMNIIATVCTSLYFITLILIGNL